MLSVRTRSVMQLMIVMNCVCSQGNLSGDVPIGRIVDFITRTSTIGVQCQILLMAYYKATTQTHVCSFLYFLSFFLSLLFSQFLPLKSWCPRLRFLGGTGCLLCGKYVLLLKCVFGYEYEIEVLVLDHVFCFTFSKLCAVWES
jgi:hypothetical protein